MQTQDLELEDDAEETFQPFREIQEWAKIMGWATALLGKDQLEMSVNADFSGSLSFAFSWFPDQGMLIYTCAYSLAFGEESLQAIYETIALLNISSALGHFAVDKDSMCIGHSSTILMMEDDDSDTFFAEVGEHVHNSIDACEQGYPVFVSVLYEKLPPVEAMAESEGGLVGRA